MTLPGFDDWLDNHGNPGLAEEADDDNYGWEDEDGPWEA